MTNHQKSKLAILSCLLVLCWIANSCKKTDDANSSQAKMSVTNLVYNGQPVDVLYQEVKITDSGKIASDSTTGVAGNPYLSVVAGTHNFKVTPNGTDFWVDGNISLITNLYYSVFIYDTLQNNKAAALALKDVLNILPDTLSSYRILNFSPDTLSFVLIDNRADTVIVYNLPPINSESSVVTLSAFHAIKSGDYGVIAFKDTLNAPVYAQPDTLHLAGTKSYTFFTRGAVQGSGAGSLRLPSLRHN